MSMRPAQPLTRQRMFERALAIVDADGLDALTMRRLAAELGVQAPSLYNHVAGKDDLLDGALRVMRAEFRLPAPAPGDWKLLMAAIFTEYRRVLSAHPNMMPLAGRRLSGEGDSGLEYLTGLGFSVDEAVEMWQSLLALTAGFSLFASGHTATDTRGLSAPLRERAAQWRDETFHQALLALMERYEQSRAVPAPGVEASNDAGMTP